MTLNKKIELFLQEDKRDDFLVSLRQFMWRYELSEMQFLELKSRQKEMIRNKLVHNIVTLARNVKDLLVNLDLEFEKVVFIKDNVMKIEWIDAHKTE